MQTETTLSTTEAEFIALGEGLRIIIPLIGLMEETPAGSKCSEWPSRSKVQSV